MYYLIIVFLGCRFSASPPMVLWSMGSGLWDNVLVLVSGLPWRAGFDMTETPPPPISLPSLTFLDSTKLASSTCTDRLQDRKAHHTVSHYLSKLRLPPLSACWAGGRLQSRLRNEGSRHQGGTPPRAASAKSNVFLSWRVCGTPGWLGCWLSLPIQIKHLTAQKHAHTLKLAWDECFLI